MSGAMFGLQAGMQLGDAYTQSQAEKSKGRAEGTALDINARFKRLQAVDAVARGHEAAGRVLRDAAAVRGTQRAGFAGQGVDVHSGTAAAIQAETDATAQRDVVTVSNNAWRTAWGLNIEADSLEAEGRMKRAAAKAKSRSTLITGGLQALDTYGRFKADKSARSARGSAASKDTEDLYSAKGY